MCGRVFVKSSVSDLLRAFAFARAGEAERIGNTLPRFNGAPGQDYPLIVWEFDMPGAIFTAARWGLIPGWVKEATGGRKPINARCETVATSGMFRDAYRRRRALLPVDGFFEWQAIKGEAAKQPYAIAMKDGSPFALAAIWETWHHPETREQVTTFAVITCHANELVRQIHDRMPVIVAPEDYQRWLSEAESDPRDLLRPYPAEPMSMWPISRRVNRPRNDTPDLLDRIDLGDDGAF